MPEVSNRMMRATTFSDGRLLRVSPNARLLAIVLEALAEATGVVKLDPHEIRSAAGFYLADSDETPPTPAQIEAWTNELVAQRWAVEYERDGVRLIYLKGFGERQLGSFVSIGFSPTTGEVAPHLPIPQCVLELRPQLEKGAASRKLIPIHCEKDYANCPCEGVKGSGTMPQQSGNAKEKVVDREADLEARRRSVSPRDGGVGEGTSSVPISGSRTVSSQREDDLAF